MSTGAIIGIIIAVIIVAAVAVVASAQLRRARMRRQFGPEYDRLAKEIGPRKAEAELTARQRRVEALDIHPLSAEQQARYSSDWTVVQERFVDAPTEAVTAAHTLVWDVMRDRGYPADDSNASIEALSVYHARSLEGYRNSRNLRTESATTEQLREALINYRGLFEDLTGLRGRPARVREAQLNANSDLAAQNGDLTAQDGDLATENTDRTADTPR
jgi:hypothetical protein